MDKENTVYTYTMKYLATRKKGILLFVTTWMDLEGIMLSKIILTEKDKHCMVSFICEILKKNKKTRTHRNSTMVVAHGEGEIMRRRQPKNKLTLPDTR